MKLQTLVNGLVCASLLSVITLHAQQASDSSVATLRTETLYVQVPISALDKQGHPVHGLTKDNFVVKEDGKVQKIATFEHIEHVANPSIQLKVPEGVYTNRVEQDQPARLTIIAIDAVSTKITERLEARKQILNFISRNVSVDQPVALVMMGQNQVKVLHDFTTDPRVLIAATKHIVSGYSAGASVAADNSIIQQQPSPLATGMNSVFEQMQMAESDTIQTSFQGFIVGQQRNMVRNTVDSFNDIARAFIGIPGRKSLIWITNGESINTGDVDIAKTLDQRNTVAATLNVPGLSSNHIKDSLMTLSDAGVRTNDFLQRTWRLLNDSNIAVYPLDISDISNPAFTDPGTRVRSALNRPVNEITRLEQFADATGGSLCLRDSNLDDCMKRANEDSQDYYLAGYYAVPSTKKATWRSIQVSSNRNDLKVRARTGYYVRPPSPDDAKVAYNEVLGAIGSPLKYTSLPLEVKLDGEEPSEKDHTKRKVKFVIFIPPTADFISESSNSMDLAFAVVAKQSDGKPVADFEREAAGALKPAAVADLSIHGFVISGFLDLVPGSYELKCVARDNHNGHLGSLSIPLKVNGTGLDAHKN
jgi:VWFA-related protein